MVEVTACEECGITSRGAVVRKFEDGRELCEDCWPDGECRRCGRETSQITLSGEYRCRECQRRKRQEKTTRDADQEGLGRWSA